MDLTTGKAAVYSGSLFFASILTPAIEFVQLLAALGSVAVSVVGLYKFFINRKSNGEV